jgi:predicted aspartyl protease
MKKNFIVFLLFFLISCKDEKKDPPFYEPEQIVDTTLGPGFGGVEADELISVPYREENGVKYVKVSVNGIGFEMIFDTGCSSTLISIAEAKYLYEKGYLTSEDYLGNLRSTIADGSIVEDMIFNLKKVVINDKIICENVKAEVSKNSNAPLLLGNDVLNRVASYTINNENSTIDFKLK